MKYRIVIITIIAFIVSCSTKEPSISIVGFDTGKWKQDTIGFNGYRDSVTELLISNKQLIIGLDKEAVNKLFGTPNYIGNRNTVNESWSYYLMNREATKGLVLNDSLYKKIKFSELPVLMFSFYNDTIKYVGRAIP